MTLHIPPSSFLLIQRSSFYTSDHLWLLSRISSPFRSLRRIRRWEERRPRTHVSSRAQLNELSAFFARARHSFLDCICPLLDIPFYWTKPRSLPSFLAFPLASFRFAVDYTREDTSPFFLWDSIYPILPSTFLSLPTAGTPFDRNACPSFLTTRLSSATSFYSASRISNVIIHPSANPFANLRSLSSSISG